MNTQISGVEFPRLSKMDNRVIFVRYCVMTIGIFLLADMYLSLSYLVCPSLAYFVNFLASRFKLVDDFFF